jgi:two-component system chemotaxis response regulator CheB
MRKIITDLFEADPTIEVVGTARNGREALEKVKELDPDVVTLDVEMPIMNGLDALEQIMAQAPRPVIMLSSLTSEGADATIRALELGAVDFITKPTNIFRVNTEEVRTDLTKKIKIAAKIKVSRATAAPARIRIPEAERKPRPSGKLKKIVAIGTSTGGPRALQTVIPALPADLDAAVLVVQHMPPGFTKSLSERMNTLSTLRVKEAEEGETLQAGCVYIAPGDRHLKIVMRDGAYVVSLDPGETVSGHRPSADALFASLDALGLDNIVGVIMTGMGSDGAKGLRALKGRGNHIIAQNEESCVVYGMPRAAVNMGIVDRVVDLQKIAGEIEKAVGV